LASSREAFGEGLALHRGLEFFFPWHLVTEVEGKQRQETRDERREGNRKCDLQTEITRGCIWCFIIWSCDSCGVRSNFSLLNKVVGFEERIATGTIWRKKTGGG
jgi:hypothetical protein